MSGSSQTARRRRPLLAALGVVLSMLVALLVPAVSANAATSVPSGKTASASANKSTEQAKVPATKASATQPVDVPQPAKRPAPPAPVHLAVPARVSAAAAKAAYDAPSAQQARAAAAEAAVARDTVVNTCSGAISPDIVYSCATPSASGTDTFTITLTGDSDLLFFALDSTSPSGASFVSLTAPGSTTATTCLPNLVGSEGQCAASGPGTYTVTVPSNGVSYTLSYLPILSDTNCPAAALSFADAPQQSAIPAAAAGVCETLAQASGDVLQVGYDSSSSGTLLVLDSTGTDACNLGADPCTLTGVGPYRVLFATNDATDSTLTIQLESLTDPTGCQSVALQAYGTVPDASSTDQCRSVDVTAAGAYQVYATNSQTSPASLFASDGSVACTSPTVETFCQLAVGTYYLVEPNYQPSSPSAAFGTVFIAADETRGCEATGDTDFATGPVSGSFTDAGQVQCLTLPTASGLADYLFSPDDSGGNLLVAVVDAAGAEQCHDLSQNNDVCALTGVAPFHVVLADVAALGSGTYSMLIQRTDSSAGCTAWPQSGFGGSWGATVTTVTGQNNYDCLAIPANGHSTGEMIDYADTTNTEDGAIFVADSTGKQACLVLNTSICSYKPGVAYTAILDNSGQAQTYDLVRRDVSSTAPCAAPASTVPGGASTPITLTSDLDTVCYRITAATADELMLAVNAEAPGSATATLQVADASGTLVCRQWGVSCQVTGSTSYQLLVTATGYAGAAIAAQLDTWRVATAAGWAPQCTAHPLSANGWAPFSGAITQSSSGYCAVVSYQPNQNFFAYGTTPVESGYPWLSMYTSADWTQGIGLCYGTSLGWYSFTCQTTGSAAGQAVLMVIARGAQFPEPYTFQGVCQRGCSVAPGQATISAISPASQPARSANQVTVTGTNLNLGTSVMLATAGSPVSPYSISTPVSVNAAGTSLTVDLDTSTVTPGKYDVALNATSTVTPSGPAYLSGAYTVIPALPSSTSTVFALGPGNASVQEWGGSANGWVTIGGPASAVYAGGAGVFALNPNGSMIYQYNQNTGGWTEVGGAGAQFVVSGDALYALTTNRAQVMRFNGTTWTQVGGAAQGLYASASGAYATAPGNTAIYDYNGTGWTKVGGAGSLFATSGATLYGLTPNHSAVYRWSGTGTSWTQIGGSAGQLYAGGYGLFATNPSNTALYQFTGTPNTWTKIGGGGHDYAVSQTTIYGQSSAGGNVYAYTGTPGNWTNIGGNPTSITGG